MTSRSAFHLLRIAIIECLFLIRLPRWWHHALASVLTAPICCSSCVMYLTSTLISLALLAETTRAEGPAQHQAQLQLQPHTHSPSTTRFFTEAPPAHSHTHCLHPSLYRLLTQLHLLVLPHLRHLPLSHISLCSVLFIITHDYSVFGDCSSLIESHTLPPHPPPLLLCQLLLPPSLAPPPALQLSTPPPLALLMHLPLLKCILTTHSLRHTHEQP